MKFFASEPDFDAVIGDLSEGFQRQVSAVGRAAARSWYWKEAFRNARAFGKRELLRTPFLVLAVTALVFAAFYWIGLLGEQLLVNIQWAWIPPRFWRLYQVSMMTIVFPASLLVGAGASSARLVKSRELSLSVAFATLVFLLDLDRLCVLLRHTAVGSIPGNLRLAQVALSWVLGATVYSAGCFWMRWRRLAHL
jgi:hypothetical protein